MTRRDRKLLQQGGLLSQEQPLRRIKGSQLLTLEEGTGEQRGALVQEAASLIQKSLRPGDVFPSFPQPTNSSFHAKGVGIWWGFSGTASNHPTQRESAEFPSEPHVRWGLEGGGPKEQP